MRTPSRGEIEAWKQLRLLRAEGFAFRREQKLDRYWADFICLRRKVIIEIDGPLHDSAEAGAHDRERDAWLTSEGYRVMRFAERKVLSEENWLAEVREMLNARPDFEFRKRSAPHPLPPPPLGEGK